MSSGPNSFAPCDWLELSGKQGALPSELTVQKVITFHPLKLRLSGTWDLDTGRLTSKASLKECILDGKFRFFPSDQAVEYRKRFSLFGLASAHVWSRWELSARRLRHEGWGTAWRPRLGFGLGLGENLGGGLRSLPQRLLLVRPLTYAFKAKLPLSPGLAVKTYCDATLRLPPRLSLGSEGPGADWDDEEEGGSGFGGGGGGGAGGSALLLRLNRAAIVLSL